MGCVVPGAGTPIQDAIDGAGAGDTIYVHAGTYVENVNVDKRLTLIGAGADVVTVRAADAWGDVFNVTTDWVNISGFTVTGTTHRFGVYLDRVDYCNISGNTVSNNSNGIFLWQSSNDTIVDNNVSNNNRCGICLYYPTNNTLSNNIAKFNNEYGIFVGDGLKNIISNNICEGNGGGVFLGDIYMQGDDNDTPVLDNAVINNTCKNNTDFGIALTGCLNNTILSNLCENNKQGIVLGDPINNTLYHNNLINNTYGNAYDPYTNTWDSGSEGNYYSDYICTDSDGDGIGDTPYSIPGGTSTDRFPLMYPWTPLQKGDLNGDGILTPADAAIALRLAASGAQNPAADVSGDDRVTSLDALMILQAAAGRIKL